MKSVSSFLHFFLHSEKRKKVNALLNPSLSVAGAFGPLTLPEAHQAEKRSDGAFSVGKRIMTIAGLTDRDDRRVAAADKKARDKEDGKPWKSYRMGPSWPLALLSDNRKGLAVKLIAAHQLFRFVWLSLPPLLGELAGLVCCPVVLLALCSAKLVEGKLVLAKKCFELLKISCSQKVNAFYCVTVCF